MLGLLIQDEELGGVVCGFSGCWYKAHSGLWDGVPKRSSATVIKPAKKEPNKLSNKDVGAGNPRRAYGCARWRVMVLK